MKTKIISIFLCLVFFSSCKDDGPTFIYGEGEIEYNTDSPDWFPGYPNIVLLYTQRYIYDNLIETIIDKEDAKKHEITITEIKLKSGILIPDGLLDEGFMKLEGGSIDIIEFMGTGINTTRNYHEIGILDLANSTKTELIFQPNDLNLLAYLDSRYREYSASIGNQFEFNSSVEPKLKFSYFHWKLGIGYF